VARLNGTGRLADDLYLLAHHEITGRPFLRPRVTGLVLAAALLADLILTGHLSLKGGEPVPLDCPPPGDELSRRDLNVLRSEPGHLARVWLLYLARTAAPAKMAMITASTAIDRSQPVPRLVLHVRWTASGTGVARAAYPGDPDHAAARAAGPSPRQ
jgi:hypothetical protein